MQLKDKRHTTERVFFISEEHNSVYHLKLSLAAGTVTFLAVNISSYFYIVVSLPCTISTARSFLPLFFKLKHRWRMPLDQNLIVFLFLKLIFLQNQVAEILTKGLILQLNPFYFTSLYKLVYTLKLIIKHPHRLSS
jgi:hypothetical protein